MANMENYQTSTANSRVQALGPYYAATSAQDIADYSLPGEQLGEVILVGVPLSYGGSESVDAEVQTIEPEAS